MKYVFIVLGLLLLFVAACTSQVDVETNNEVGEVDETSKDEYANEYEKNVVLCAEGSEDGHCDLSDTPNVNLFETDLSGVTVEQADHGIIARPTAQGNYPGVVMIHEWWGLNEHIEEMAQILANEGYIVYAVDLYNGSVGTNSSEAGALAGAVRNNPQPAIDIMTEAVATLREESDKVASLGWCFGGQQSLNLALSGSDVDATVIYYGNLVTNSSELAVIDHPVLGVFGELDNGIPPEQVYAFDDALPVGLEKEIYIYKGVGHAFANPSGSRYGPQETVDAWLKTTDFLERHLK